MNKRVVFPICALLLGWLGERTANAQAATATDGELSIQRFAPAPGPRNFVTVEGARTSGSMAFSLGLFGNYAHNPLVITRCNSSGDCSSPDATRVEERVVVESLMTADLLASLTVLPRLQLGLRVPFSYVHGPGVETDLSGSNPGGPLRDGMKAGAFGDAMFEAKGRLYGEVPDDIVLGAAVFATAPIGHSMAEGKYIGDTSPTVGIRGIYDGSSGPLSFGANLAGVYRKEARLGSSELGSELRYGLAVGYRISPVFRIIGEGIGTTKLSAAKGTNTVEALLAGQITPLGSGLAITAGGGAGVVRGMGVPDFRGFLGFAYSHEMLDSDGDRIPDDVDRCPTEPEDYDGFQDDDGCPDADNDRDGVVDWLDACPDTPGDPHDDPTKNGCPGVFADRDGDGIPDAEDMCPDDGGPTVIRRKGDAYGCPDRDRDGIADKDDRCPDDPEDTDGFQDEDGCPDPDNDGDGIPDKLDLCVDEPETFNGFEDEDGCPDTVPTEDAEGASEPSR